MEIAILILIAFSVVFILIDSVVCVNQRGHKWELKDVYEGKNNRIHYYQCRNCYKERNEGWIMKKT